MRSAKSRDFDGGAAQAESKRQAEIGIARDAGEEFDAVGDELLHQECAVRWRRIEPVEALAQLREGVRKLRVVLEADGDEAELGLVGDVVRHRLEHDGVAELARGACCLGDRRDARFARDRHAKARQQSLRIVFVDGSPSRSCRKQVGELHAGAVR